jgi:uncharacterized FlgJ-related protein
MNFRYRIADSVKNVLNDKKIVSVVKESKIFTVKAKKPTVKAVNKTIYITPQKFPKAFLYRHVKFPNIVYKQSHLETRHYTSKIFRENRNNFGMKRRTRSPYQVGELNGHAAYNSLYDSILDYADWQNERMTAYERHFNKTIKTEDDYYHFLNNIVIGKNIYRYAEDLAYTDKLRKLSVH